MKPRAPKMEDQGKDITAQVFAKLALPTPQQQARLQTFLMKKLGYTEAQAASLLSQ